MAQHHEKWDGSGYPLGLRGEDIDLCARIFSVADAFDAMTSDRVYRKGKSYEAAAQELDEWAGKQFDPKVVEAFHRVPKGLGRAARTVAGEEGREFEVHRMIEMLESQLEAVVS